MLPDKVRKKIPEIETDFNENELKNELYLNSANFFVSKVFVFNCFGDFASLQLF